MADKQVITKSAGRALLAAVENAQLRKDIPEIKSGDTVRLQVRVVEGNRERLQPFEGVVMRLRGGGVNQNFTVRRITHGVGVERTFLIHSPRIEKIEVLRHARVRDSKQMTAQARDRLYDVIMLHALATSVGMGSVELIDERNILQATKHAMYAAIAQLSVPVQALLIDALILPRLSLPQRPIIKGDERCLSIAAASIIAKVTRDRLMLQLHEQYPLYGFNQNKGYGTPAHLAALHEH